MTMPSDELIRADWWRAVMYAELAEQIGVLHLHGVGVELGGSNGVIQAMCPGVRWETRDYPTYDVLDPESWDREWDVVILDQVLEHVARPWEVFAHLAEHCETAIITVPFLIGLHPCPYDFWRMAPDGIRYLAELNGFGRVDIRTWGNARAALWHAEFNDTERLLANIPEETWRAGLAENDPAKPFVIWAVLQK